jgi:hypothetical protein
MNSTDPTVETSSPNCPRAPTYMTNMATICTRLASGKHSIEYIHGPQSRYEQTVETQGFLLGVTAGGYETRHRSRYGTIVKNGTENDYSKTTTVRETDKTLVLDRQIAAGLRTVCGE